MPEDPGIRVRSPLVELTLARVRELVREPEAVFWVFVFPILLAGILGLAFRSRPPESPFTKASPFSCSCTRANVSSTLRPRG